MSFSQIIKEHKKEVSGQRKQTDIKKIEAVKAVENAMTNLSTSLSNGNKGGITHGVAQVYKNQQQLDKEVKSLQAQTAKFAKQTGRWFQAYKGLNEALKELGDVRTWASVMENDMKAIVIALNDAEDILQGQKQNQNKWNGSQK